MNRTGKKNGEKGKTRRKKQKWNNTEREKREVEEKNEK